MQAEGNFASYVFSLVRRHKRNIKSLLNFRNIAQIAVQMLLTLLKNVAGSINIIISKYLILSWFCLTLYSASVLTLSKKIKKKIPVDSCEPG